MKSISIAIFSFLLLTGIDLIAQTRQYETNPDRKRAYNWLFGNKVWLDYNTNPPQMKPGSQLNALESASAYSDTAGNLLLYSNGISIWNSKHNVIINGTGLNGNNSSSQGVLFVKHPALDSIVYLFTTDAQGGSKGLQVSIISIHPDIDSSKVIEKNIILNTSVCESISATQHQNGRYTWIAVHSKFGNTFYSYIVTDNGILKCPVYSNQGYIYDGNIFNCQTTSRFSSNGNHFAINMFNDDKIMLLKFSNLTGNFQLLKNFQNLNIPTGISYSNNDSFLYTIERNTRINQIGIYNSQNNIIKVINNQFNIIQIEKTPNKEILANILDSFYLASITYPDSIGLKSNFVLRRYNLNGIKSKNGLCNFNQSYFHTPSIDFTYNYDCITNTISFEGRDTFYADSFHWQAKKVYGSVEQTVLSKNPNISFKDTGWYEIRFIATKGNRSDTVKKQIELLPKINKGFLGKDTTYQSNVPFSLQLSTPPNMHCILWHDSSSSNTFKADTTGVFYVKVTNKSFCTVSDTIIVSRCNNSLKKPILYRSQDTLFAYSPNADSLLWYKDGKLMAQTKDTFLLLTDTGIYKIVALKPGYCMHPSESFSYPCMVSLNQISVQIDRDTLIAYYAEADSFNWYWNNQLLKTTKDSFFVLPDTGVYRVEALKSKICGVYSKFVEFRCLNTLNTPTLIRSRDTLYAVSSQTDSFIWFKNGIRIHIGIDSFLKISDTGSYRVEILKRKYCNQSSEKLHVEKLDVGIKITDANILRIYPNPAEDMVYIETDIEGGYAIKVFNPEGKQMLEKAEIEKDIQLDISQFTHGIYFIELNYKGIFYHYKLLIH